MRNEGYVLKKTNVDDLNQRISIYKATAARGEKGNAKYSYPEKELCSVWASVKAYDAKNTMGESTTVNEIDYKILIRYRTDIAYPDRILWAGKTLHMIHAPINVESRNKWLQLDCRELVK